MSAIEWIGLSAAIAWVAVNIYAFRHDGEPFWTGWLDVATLRILWK